MNERYLLERAWVDGAVRADVLVEVADGRFASVEADRAHSDSEVSRIPGLTLPGLANTHSHAFHRALRGRTQRDRGTFWTWREQMYAVAERLDPDTYLALARATYREMAASGATAVGEFHYLHHGPGGAAYADPNEMGHALVQAAREAGIRIALLDTCYLAAGFGEPPAGVQVRYSDGDANAWGARLRALRDTYAGDPDVVIGAAIHSVRAVPADQLATVVEAAAGIPLHVHLSEQVAENQACQAAHGCTPTRLLDEHGALGPLTSVIHATHLTVDDISELGAAQVYASFCPTTERDLGDGIGPSRALHDAGARLTLGSDSHAVIDPFEELRALELDERLATQERGHWPAADLLDSGTWLGQQSLGFTDAGRIVPGQRADLVTIDLATPRTAGTGGDEQTAVFAAVAEDVTRTMTGGRIVASAADRAEIGRELADAMAILRSR